ncbi:tripartite motif-containing protein 59-like [Lytechinus variegatus]|uniref:tripartite motif-containing protein 59-like n=1 Tax=Lytechinus variegatus TaxID=7654 RepID=UPI001BB1AF2C|nr:tripartite motif-containing protein 59-like [Lytechinus variegatus]
MAAATTTSSFEREVECSICHELFEDPRSLSCAHTFCFECVQRLTEGNRSVACPLCRKKTALPSNGAMGLTKNSLAQMLVDFVKKTGFADKLNIACQSEHDIRLRAEFFCKSCKSVVCGSCGMKYHREQSKHQTFPIDEVLKMEDNLRDLLEWGKNEEREQGKRKELLELKQQEVTTRFTAVEAAINHTFAEESKFLDDRKTSLKQQLWDMKRSIKTALQKQCDAEEETKTVTELNSLTEDILEGGVNALMEMHDEISSGYQSQKRNTVPTTLSDSLQHVSDLISSIKFQQELKKGKVGRIVSNTGNWMIGQVRFLCDRNSGVDSNCKPSSIIELSNGNLAVGFSTQNDIQIFDKSYHRSSNVPNIRPLAAVTDMSQLSSIMDNDFLVLDEDGDVSRVYVSRKNSMILFEGAIDQFEDDLGEDTPHLIAADDSIFALLYKDRVKSFTIEGEPEQTIKLPSRDGDKPLRMQIHRKSGGSDVPYLEILIANGESVRSVHCELSQCQRIIVSETRLHEMVAIHGRNIGHAVDKEGNLFVAYTQDDKFITIRKYVGGDLSKEEIVICDLQVMMDDDGTVLLASLSPTCLVMCTSQKMSVFTKPTVDEFVHGIFR